MTENEIFLQAGSAFRQLRECGHAAYNHDPIVVARARPARSPCGDTTVKKPLPLLACLIGPPLVRQRVGAAGRLQVEGRHECRNVGSSVTDRQYILAATSCNAVAAPLPPCPARQLQHRSCPAHFLG